MKKHIQIIVFLLFFQAVSYAQCICLGGTSPLDRTLVGNAETTYDFALVRLTNRQTITPEVGKSVNFSLRDLLRLPATSNCTHSIRFQVRDDSRTLLYETTIEGNNTASFNYTFPRVGVRYHVHLLNAYIPPRGDLVPDSYNVLASDCTQGINVFVVPRPDPCNCADPNILVGGTVKGKAGFLDMYDYEAAINVKNRSACNLKIESITIAGKTKTGIDINVPNDEWGINYNDNNFSGSKPSVYSLNKTAVISVNISYSFNNAPPCTKSFPVPFTDITKK